MFVENTSVRAPRPTDLGRIIKRFRRWSRGSIEHVAEASSQIDVFSPLVAPYPYSAWSRRLNQLSYVPRIAALAQSLADPLIWAFLPTPTVLDAVRAARQSHSAVVYYCVSDFAEVTSDIAGLQRSEAQMASIADVIFTNGERLRRKFADQHPRVRTFPFGVDIERFDPRLANPEPADMSHIPRPRVGYVGGLHHHIAVEWMEAAIKRLPNVSFVLVGPSVAGSDVHLRGSNVHLLGPRSHAELPSYLAAFDVCIVPYRSSPYTASVVPTKMFEYLAMGKPVVMSALPELEHMPNIRRVVAAAADADAFTNLVALASTERAEQSLVEERRRAVAPYSWDRMFAEMLREVEGAVALRQPASRRDV